MHYTRVSKWESWLATELVASGSTHGVLGKGLVPGVGLPERKHVTQCDLGGTELKR